jgi:hypothetical protein
VALNPAPLALNHPLRACIDRLILVERAGRLPRATVDLVLAGIDIVLGR